MTEWLTGSLTESVFVETLLTRLNAQLLYNALPPSEERWKLDQKIRCLEIVLKFLRATLGNSHQFWLDIEVWRPLRLAQKKDCQ